jgi:hypothetical protein
MKSPEYVEGQKALANFESGMKAIFKAPKVETKKKKTVKPSSLRKPKNADKD